MAVVFPHRLKIQRAQYQRFEQQLIRQDSRKCRRHKGLAESDNVGEQNTSAFLHMMRRDLYRLFLELEELVAEVFGNAVANDAISRFLGEMVGHLDIDVVRRDWLWASPALVDNVGNLLGDVQTPFVTPPFVKPLRQFSQASWSVTSTFNSPCFDSPAKVKLLLPRNPIAGLTGSCRKSK